MDGRRIARWIVAPLLVLLGVMLSGAGKAALEHTNTTDFCISCHEMKTHNYAEYRDTIHAQPHTGVTAGCADCHVPHEFPDVLWRKVGAAHDLWAHWTGALQTPQQFEQKRLELAKRVWLRMKTTDSRECRHCHDAKAMSADLQGRTAQKQHQKIGVDGKTCIDCHYGIAHREPAEGAEPADVLAGREGNASR